MRPEIVRLLTNAVRTLGCSKLVHVSGMPINPVFDDVASDLAAVGRRAHQRQEFRDRRCTTP